MHFPKFRWMMVSFSEPSWVYQANLYFLLGHVFLHLGQNTQKFWIDDRERIARLEWICLNSLLLHEAQEILEDSQARGCLNMNKLVVQFFFRPIIIYGSNPVSSLWE